jgi:hypothetical protein
MSCLGTFYSKQTEAVLNSLKRKPPFSSFWLANQKMEPAFSLSSSSILYIEEKLIKPTYTSGGGA